MLTAMPLMAADVAGTIGYMSGTLVAKHADGKITVLAPKSQVLEGDMLSTSVNSYAQVLMNDGSKMTVRPESNLKIESFTFRKDAPQADNAIFRLLKGGFRTVTGLIGKRGNPDAYQLRASSATIGIRGTDFTTRLCASKDCKDESAKPKEPAATAIGRVMLLQGEMEAKEASGNVRKLGLGSPVYEGDTLNTGVKTNAIVAFRDESRITLQENTSFHVESFKYNKAATAQDNAVLRLIKGGVRVVTGLIGRVNHDNYKFSVAGATIGIRGTGFDAWCNGGCATGGNSGTTPDKPLDGLGLYVWSGAVVLVTPNGTFNIALQQAVFLSKETGKALSFKVVPKVILENGAPRPDSIPVDMLKEFGADAEDGETLYVTVHDGKVIIFKGDQKLDLGSGESGFSDRSSLNKLSYMPAFMSGDQGLNLNTPDKGFNQKGCIVR